MDKIDKLMILQSKLERIQQQLLKTYGLEIVSVGRYRGYHLVKQYKNLEDREAQEGFAIVFKEWR